MVLVLGAIHRYKSRLKRRGRVFSRAICWEFGLVGLTDRARERREMRECVVDVIVEGLREIVYVNPLYLFTSHISFVSGQTF